VAECIILVGLQGAGKTTLYRQRFAASHAHVSMDLFPNARNKAARLLLELARSLDEGRSVVIDNTNPTPESRAPLIAVALARGARVIGYSVEATSVQALMRNRRREGRARVPDVAIFSTARRLQPPRHSEGFERLYRVRAGEDGTFEIAEIAG
jgi:predicted kinase